jgi:TonB family protein
MLSAGALLGFVILFTGLTSFWIWGLFQTNLNFEAVGAEDYLGAVYASNDAAQLEEKEPVVKNNDKGGGGGGGGQQSKTEASHGKEPQMMKIPTDVKPDVNTYKNDRFELKQPIAVKGPENQPVDKRNLPYGIESSKNLDPSGGTGMNGGIGSGNNGGVGSGLNSGIGSGANGGRGSGKNGGLGGGDGPGSDSTDLPDLPKKEVAKQPAVTVPLTIISKPRANYTEEARKQSIQGVVVLKVTFSSSGQITNIAAVKGLGGGLTERAIVAAKQIQFSPKKVNGQAVSVSKNIEYAFNMY